jgi:PAS domain S-box-containing protein
MPQSEPVSILVVSDVAEEIKLVTRSFRGFFPGCRVDAVYSLDEALQWAPRTAWHLILLDDHLIEQPTTSMVQELRRLAPDASLVLQTDRSDSTAAVNTLQAGADFLLYKKSPAFLTELVLYAREAFELRDVRLTLGQTQERHARLIETLTDVLYELDAEGRFRYLSAPVADMLGYAPDELVGASYSMLLPPDQLDRARHHFDDRRTGTRACRHLEVDLAPKAAPDAPTPPRVRVELSARGLYDSHRRYRGTLGLLRDVSRRRDHEAAIRQLERQLQDAEHLIAMVRQLSALSRNLRTPQTAVLAQSRQLLATIREARLSEQVESLMHQAAEAVRLGEELAGTVPESAGRGETINDVIDAVLDTLQPSLLDTDRVERAYAGDLPPFTGHRDRTMRLLRLFLLHAHRYTTIVGSHHRLRISTSAIGPSGLPIEAVPTLFPAPSPVEVEIHLEETEVSVGEPPSPQEAVDLLDAYALIKQLGGRVDYQSPAGGRLSVRIWIPVAPFLEPPASSPVQDLPVSSVAPSVKSWDSTRPERAELPASAPSTAPAGPPGPLPDRRCTLRLSVHLPARITIGNVTRDGTVTDLGPGGASLAIQGQLPTLDQQPAYVILKTEAGLLELQATVHDRGTIGPETATSGRNSLLAFHFVSLSDIERNVLASILSEASDRSFSLTVEALLSLPDRPAEVPPDEGGTDLRGTDHREAVRVRVAMPARIESPARSTTGDLPLSLVVNFSRTGACLQMAQVPGAPGDLITLHFPTAGSLDRPRTHEPEAPEATLTARIIWTADDHRIPSELRPAPALPGQRIGVRFVSLIPFAEREINRVVKQHIGSSMDLEGIAGRSSIVSARRECRNARDQVIALTDDHARHQISPSTPIVVIAPGFGQTQTDYLPLSFYLAAGRFRVLRYDHTNHIGQSDGDILQTTLRSMQVDLQTVLEFAHSTWPTAPLTLFAEDIAARVALKVLARSHAADRLLLLNPVFDLQSALLTTFRHDVITDHRHGLRRGVANLWGLNVNLDQFVSDAIAGGLADLATASSDLGALDHPPVIFTTPRRNRLADSSFGSLDRALEGLGAPPLVVPLQVDVSGETGASDERHLTAFRMMMRHMAAPTPADRPSPQMREPTAHDIHHQRQLEQERVRIRHHVSQATRDALWIARLAQLSELGNLPDYWALEDELYRRLLPLTSGMTVIDVGCGQGDLARVMLTNQAYRSIHQSGPTLSPLHYVGLGQSHESLKTAEHYVQTFVRELTTAFSSALLPAQLVKTEWLWGDWDSPLPLMNGSADRILYHLSLAFAPSPLHALRQALPALRPDGMIIVTCFQPQADLSTLFRRHLQASGLDEFGAPAQIVLHYLGRLREALRHGLLHSFERTDLTRLLAHAGARLIRVDPLLEDHLLIAVVGKAKSAG